MKACKVTFPVSTQSSREGEDHFQSTLTPDLFRKRNYTIFSLYLTKPNKYSFFSFLPEVFHSPGTLITLLLYYELTFLEHNENCAWCVTWDLLTALCNTINTFLFLVEVPCVIQPRLILAFFIFQTYFMPKFSIKSANSGMDFNIPIWRSTAWVGVCGVWVWGVVFGCGWLLFFPPGETRLE